MFVTLLSKGAYMNIYYIPPQVVKSPKSRIQGKITVLRDGGPYDWSLAKFKWDGKESLGIRWNGGDEDNGLGNPQSRGLPTWFILPEEVEQLFIKYLEKENKK